MPVSKDCRTNTEAVLVKVVGGERLFYEIEVTNGEVVYTLDEHPSERPLADSVSCPSRCERSWPRDDSEVPAEDMVTHTLALQFRSPGTIKYVVRHRRNGGEDVLIDCDYVSADANASYFEALDVFIGRA